MKITDVKIGLVSVPLLHPFKTALRTVDSVEDVIIEVHTDSGEVGFGEAPPTGAVTGDTQGSIIGALKDHIIKNVVGKDVEDFENLLLTNQRAIMHNTSAKACMDMALYDLYGKLLKVPVYKMLGASRSSLETDITISVNSPEEMARDSMEAIKRGYNTLKLKVGVDPKLDVERLVAIRKAVGNKVCIRIDANQAWSPREAISILNEMQMKGLDIEFVEQPVKAGDLHGLKKVRDNSYVPVLADESVFSPEDALKILQMGACDYINIKLMKTGGIYNALKIASLCELYGVECMIGCMLEAKVSVNAAVHLACSKGIITKIDLDGPVLCASDPVEGGSVFNERLITVSNTPGLGITKVNGIKYL